MSPALFGVLPEHPTMPEVISFQATGLMVVFLALGSLWFLLSIAGRIFAFRDARIAATKAAAAPPAPLPVVAPTPVPAEAAPSVSGPAPAVLAAIAAAVHVTLGNRARVLSVSPVRVDGDWAREGRRQIFASHRVR